MRIIGLMLTSLLIIVSLYSCGIGGRSMIIDFSDSEINADIRLEQILICILNKDAGELKQMFSRQALAESEDFDDNLERLFVLLLGNIENWERSGFISNTFREDGRVSIMSISFYTVTTDVDKYRVFTLEYTKDTFNPDNVGMYSLRIIKAIDEDTQFTYWQDMKIPGIYRYEYVS